MINDEEIRSKFELSYALPSWPNRGLNSYDFGEKCLRTSSDYDLTNGFFIAVFKKVKIL